MRADLAFRGPRARSRVPAERIHPDGLLGRRRIPLHELLALRLRTLPGRGARRFIARDCEPGGVAGFGGH